MSDYLYALASTTRKIKFGRARDVPVRRSNLQSGCSEPLFIVAIALGDGKLESPLKYALRRHQLHGEWFSYEILNLVEKSVIDGVSFGDLARRLIKSPPKVRDRKFLREHRALLCDANVRAWNVRQSSRG